MQKLISSHLPGICYKRFDDWAECEKFLGFEVFNPLEDSGEQYVATEALLARGPITYNIRVIGDKNEWDAVRATLEKVLPYFMENK